MTEWQWQVILALIRIVLSPQLDPIFGRCIKPNLEDVTLLKEALRRADESRTIESTRKD